MELYENEIEDNLNLITDQIITNILQVKNVNKTVLYFLKIIFNFFNIENSNYEKLFSICDLAFTGILIKEEIEKILKKKKSSFEKIH